MDGTLLDSMRRLGTRQRELVFGKETKESEVREKLSRFCFLSRACKRGWEYVKEKLPPHGINLDEIVTGVNNIVYTAYEKEALRPKRAREF